MLKSPRKHELAKNTVDTFHNKICAYGSGRATTVDMTWSKSEKAVCNALHNREPGAGVACKDSVWSEKCWELKCLGFGTKAEPFERFTPSTKVAEVPDTSLLGQNKLPVSLCTFLSLLPLSMLFRSPYIRGPPSLRCSQDGVRSWGGASPRLKKLSQQAPCNPCQFWLVLLQASTAPTDVADNRTNTTRNH